MVFSVFNLVCANFELTEIMYDLDGTDSNREWVEVKNIGDKTLDLSKWYLFSDNTKHALIPQIGSNIESGKYAVIVQNVLQFKNDWPNFSGLIFDSSWTGFNNNGEIISLKDPELNIVSPISYTSSLGGAGDGDSLQKINNNWVGSQPTPGLENKLIKKMEPSVEKSELVQTSDKVELDNKEAKPASAQGYRPVDTISYGEAKDEVINLNDIKTSVPRNKIPNSFYPYIGLVIVIGLGITAFLIIKKRDKEENEVEKSLTAQDIKIVE